MKPTKGTYVLSALVLILTATLIGRTVNTSLQIRALEGEIAETKMYADAVVKYCSDTCGTGDAPETEVQPEGEL